MPRSSSCFSCSAIIYSVAQIGGFGSFALGVLASPAAWGIGVESAIGNATPFLGCDRIPPPFTSAPPSTFPPPAIASTASPPLTAVDLEQPTLQLTTPDVVSLVLAHNRSIKLQLLERIAQRANLKAAQQEFTPRLTPTLTLRSPETTLTNETTLTDNPLRAVVTATMNLPIGGTLELSTNPIVEDYLNLEIELPLLRGAGSVARSDLRIARLTENSNIQELRQTLIDLITEAILAHRELLRSQETVKIQENSLERANKQLEIVQALVQAGRLAPVELLTREADVASRKLSLQQAINTFEQARLDLLQLLDVDRDLEIVIPVGSLTDIQPRQLDAATLVQQAIRLRPDLAQQELTLAINQIQLARARNDRLWTLNLEANGLVAGDDRTDISASLTLTRVFEDPEIEQAVTRQQVDLRRNQTQLEDLQDNLRIQVANEVRNVQAAFQQFQSAQRARQLAEQDLEAAEVRFQLGKATLRDTIQAQDQLEAQANNEINSAIDYLNALTRLDQIAGLTLQTWRIDLKEIDSLLPKDGSTKR